MKLSDASGEVLYGPPRTIDLAGAASGDLLHYQAWFRDQTGPCDNGSNTSSGVRVRFEP